MSHDYPSGIKAEVVELYGRQDSNPDGHCWPLDDKAKVSKQLKSKALAEFEPREINWLWKPFIPRECVTIIEGDGGIGKSSIVALIGSSVSRGLELPGDASKPPQPILLLAREDDPAAVLRPRFEKQRAALDMVRCYDQAMLLDNEGLTSLDAEIEKHRFGLVVIDPIVSFLGQKIDTSKATDVRSFMGPLHDMAKRHGCAIVVIRHWNKNASGNASSRGAGSVDFRNAARSVIQVIKSGEQSYFCLEKSNYGVARKTLKFKFNAEGAVEWDGDSSLSADEILFQDRAEAGQGGVDLAEAIDFLKEELAGGAKLSREIENAARSLSISSSTLKRAKNRIGVRAFKMAGHNAWYCDYKDHDNDKRIGTGSSSAFLTRGLDPDLIGPIPEDQFAFSAAEVSI